MGGTFKGNAGVLNFEPAHSLQAHYENRGLVVGGEEGGERLNPVCVCAGFSKRNGLGNAVRRSFACSSGFKLL
jgi:hypothetical protein